MHYAHDSLFIEINSNSVPNRSNFYPLIVLWSLSHQLKSLCLYNYSRRNLQATDSHHFNMKGIVGFNYCEQSCFSSFRFSTHGQYKAWRWNCLYNPMVSIVGGADEFQSFIKIPIDHKSEFFLIKLISCLYNFELTNSFPNRCICPKLPPPGFLRPLLVAV